MAKNLVQLCRGNARHSQTGTFGKGVVHGHADPAGLDAVCRSLIKHENPATRSRLSMSSTRPALELFFMTRPGRDLRPLFAAITKTIAGPDRRERVRRLLKGPGALPAGACHFGPLTPQAEVFRSTDQDLTAIGQFALYALQYVESSLFIPP